MWLKFDFHQEVIDMKCKWRYFIVLLSEDCYNDFVEDKEDEDGFLPVCADPAVAKLFASTDELLQWVKLNTSLKVENANFKIEGQYLPCGL